MAGIKDHPFYSADPICNFSGYISFGTNLQSQYEVLRHHQTLGKHIFQISDVGLVIRFWGKEVPTHRRPASGGAK